MSMPNTIAHVIGSCNSARYNIECYASAVSTIREIRLQRLLCLLEEHKGIKKVLAAAIGKAPAQVSQWVNGTRTITEETAREIERGAKKPPGWLDLPLDTPEPEKSPAVKADSRSGEGVESGYQLDAITVTPSKKPPRLAWEGLLTVDELPPVFEVAMPDDSMEPITPRGTILVLHRDAEPVPGHGVLVKDGRGGLYIRMYQRGPVDRWIAQPRNPGYSALDSEREDLRILATVTGRMSGVM
jgi:transcriptional regulator with XRE-family HTH domain